MPTLLESASKETVKFNQTHGPIYDISPEPYCDDTIMSMDKKRMLKAVYGENTQHYTIGSADLPDGLANMKIAVDGEFPTENVAYHTILELQAEMPITQEQVRKLLQ
jgi:hypothetical protein